MSLVPAFELGLWNAWIFVLVGLLIGFVSWVFIGRKAMRKFRTVLNVSKSSAEKFSDRIYLPLAVASMIYSIFLPIDARAPNCLKAYRPLISRVWST